MEELDLRALRAFTSVAEHGSLTRASAALEVAQSALSRRISALEEELGGRLFHRTGFASCEAKLAPLFAGCIAWPKRDSASTRQGHAADAIRRDSASS